MNDMHKTEVLLSERFRVWYFKYIDRLIPAYSVLALISCFVWNSIVYSGTKIVAEDFRHYNLTSIIDKNVPFRTEWVYVYLVCFLFWAVNYILVGREGKEKCYRFVAADLLSRCVCGIIFLVMPTTNVRPQVDVHTASGWLMQVVYELDTPVNLFPSIHCLVSWMCFIGIRKSEKVSTWYKVFSCVFALMVCASTQFTKQHYIVDAVAGIVLAETCYQISNRTDMYLIVKNVFDRVNIRIFGEN